MQRTRKATFDIAQADIKKMMSGKQTTVISFSITKPDSKGQEVNAASVVYAVLDRLQNTEFTFTDKYGVFVSQQTAVPDGPAVVKVLQETNVKLGSTVIWDGTELIRDTATPVDPAQIVIINSDTTTKSALTFGLTHDDRPICVEAVDSTNSITFTPTWNLLVQVCSDQYVVGSALRDNWLEYDITDYFALQYDSENIKWVFKDKNAPKPVPHPEPLPEPPAPPATTFTMSEADVTKVTTAKQATAISFSVTNDLGSASSPNVVVWSLQKPVESFEVNPPSSYGVFVSQQAAVPTDAETVTIYKQVLATLGASVTWDGTTLTVGESTAGDAKTVTITNNDAQKATVTLGLTCSQKPICVEAVASGKSIVFTPSASIAVQLVPDSTALGTIKAVNWVNLDTSQGTDFSYNGETAKWQAGKVNPPAPAPQV